MKTALSILLLFINMQSVFSQSARATKMQIVFPERERIKTKKQLAAEEKLKEESAFKIKVENYYFSEDEVEDDATFKLGDEKLNKFFQENIIHSVAAENDAPIGNYKVIAQLEIDKLGIIKSIKLLTKHGYGMEEEIYRVIKLSQPFWKSAILRDTSVNSIKKMVFNFEVM